LRIWQLSRKKREGGLLALPTTAASPQITVEIHISDWTHKFQNKTGLDAKAYSELYKSKRVCSVHTFFTFTRQYSDNSCAADAAFRAEQLKVAIPQWLRYNIKQKGCIKRNSKKKGICHLIKEKETKKKSSLCGGGGGSQDGNPSHPPSPKTRILPQNRRLWVKSPIPRYLLFSR
jgi:hypothetical protein